MQTKDHFVYIECMYTLNTQLHFLDFQLSRGSQIAFRGFYPNEQGQLFEF